MSNSDVNSIPQDFVRQADDAWQEFDYGKAEELLLMAYEFAKNIFGPDSDEVGLILLRLSVVCHKQGKNHLANTFLAETNRISEFYLMTSEVDMYKHDPGK